MFFFFKLVLSIIVCMKYISLFSCSGIGTFGLKENKFECIATNEILEERMKIQKYNNICKDDAAYILGDIQSKEIKNKIFNQIKKHKGVDIVIATPPCQGMSLINLKKNKDDKHRNSLVVESLEIIDKSKPKLFILENVKQFLNSLCFLNDQWISIKEAIHKKLGKEYSLVFKTLNLKNIGSKSSRTRTIVIGIQKSIAKHFSPWMLLPNRVSKTPILRNVIAKLKVLKWGEIDSNDFYHAYRIFDRKMLPWIENLKPNMSAFDNVELNRQPHKIVNGEIVINKNSTGDKYKRQDPDQVAKCVMTRSDQLASQNTIHPFENRVFSIRELMLIMSIPKKFKFLNKSLDSLNRMTDQEKYYLYKKNELNMRRSIGEAVPTFLFKKITENFRINMKKIFLKSVSEAKKFLETNKIQNNKQLIKWSPKLTSYSLNLCFELLESQSKETGLYFTNANIVTNLINDLNFKGDRILEPSVGIGSMIIPFIKAFPEKQLKIKVFDINKNAINMLKVLVKNLNVQITYKNFDFLLDKEKLKYDLSFGNPPYVKISTHIRKKYEITKNKKNLFELFTVKSTSIAKETVFVLPKYFLFNSKYSLFRNEMLNYGPKEFWDYKGMLFPNAKIETVVVRFNNKKNKNFISNKNIYPLKMLTNKTSTIWTIHPNTQIIEWASNLIYYPDTSSKRLLSINAKVITSKGKIKVWTSKNLRDKDANFIFTNKKMKEMYDKGIFVPNMTPNIRAKLRPKNTLWNGSIALIYGKILKEERNVLNTWNSKEFKEYINMLRSGAERSINIDKEIVKHFGFKYD